MRNTVLLIALAVLSIGAGPCDLFEGVGGGDAGPADCTGEMCLDQLTVELIRADNNPFSAGVYRFALSLPDGNQYSIECFMAHEESGMDCDVGDLDVMFPLVELGAARIWLIVVGAPASVLVTVEYGGIVIGEREIAPEYEEVFPEGEFCPSCFVAEESMAVMPW